MLRLLAVFAFGVVASLPIIFPELGVLGWVLLVPFGMLCLSDETRSKRMEYLYGFVFFLGYYLVCYSWFLSMYPLSVTGLSKPVSLGVVLLAWLGISAFQSVGFALVFFAVRVLKKRGLGNVFLPFACGAAWCIGEWIQNFFWFGLPWVKLALGQTEFPVLYRSANLFGSYFVTFIIVSVNLLLALSIKEKRVTVKLLTAFAALMIFSLNLLYGVADISAGSKKVYENVKISAFQGNISTEEKWTDGMLDRSLEIYERLASEAAAEGAEYALLPETVIPYVTENFPEIDGALRDIAWKNDITLMVGTFGKVGDGTGNVIRIYEPMRKGNNVYTKQKPVPFGEYIPMRDIVLAVLPVLGEINMLDRSLVPGDESSVWQGDGVMFGYLICFDSIYDSLARESVRNGAEIIMISTNDSWFGDSVGTRMHSAQAKLRAVENGRSVVRAANTGISSVITPDGETLALIPADEEGQICVNVPVSDNMTLYTKIGNLFAYICIIFGFFCMFLLKSGTKTLSYRLKR